MWRPNHELASPTGSAGTGAAPQPCQALGPLQRSASPLLIFISVQPLAVALYTWFAVNVSRKLGIFQCVPHLVKL